MTGGNDPAKARFFAIGLLRLGGVALVLIGLLVVMERIALPHALGWGMIVAGAFGFSALPLILARRWKSPPR
ncbi:hypothetical protein HME9302_00454 [Alteripontixanthobacter maritimus]|uniref:Uncharacterized protein n=1 Tax=Alteripontixanthobacter maritimus TaxID=2161824 RepID=A0A369Q7K7_9SPHN|nr:hypothetical protein [Alteripontixanthobacter maritimus]RDC59267.1 hypothetical protein HME9302_00454 [Alteripontixanthobacter maritimus]